MKDRGVDPAAGRDQLRNDPQTRDRANQATQDLDGSQFDRGQSDRGQMDRSQDRAQGAKHGTQPGQPLQCVVELGQR